MILYSKYIVNEINPQTNISIVFDKGYYKSNKVNSKDHLPIITANNRILDNNRREIMILIAYGLGQAETMKILSVYKPELNSYGRGTFKPYISKCCSYYSYHLKELYNLIGDYKKEAEKLIDFYEANKNKKRKNNLIKSQNNINLNTAEQDIRSLLETLLSYTRQCPPKIPNIQKLEEKEKDLKLKIAKCDNIEILNEYYTQLITVLSQKEEYRKIIPNKDTYRAIRCLQQCGFIESAYIWLNCFPK